jgi:hypothetical protein
MCRQCGILSISQSYRSPRPVAGIVFINYGPFWAADILRRFCQLCLFMVRNFQSLSCLPGCRQFDRPVFTSLEYANNIFLRNTKVMIVLSVMRGGMLPLIPNLGNAVRVYGGSWSVSRFWLGDWRYSSTISDFSTRWCRVVGLFPYRFNYRRNISLYQKDRKLGGSRSAFAFSAVMKNLKFTGNRNLSFQPVTRCYPD